MKSIGELLKELDVVVDKINKINEDLKKGMPDYCEIGLSHCSNCGWTGLYPANGCPECHTTFVE